MTVSKSKKQTLDISLEISGIAIILASFLYLALTYQTLPDLLPRHYGSDGLPDAYGGKGIVWVLPIVGLILYMVIGLISNFPSLINLPFTPKPENVEKYQRKYARMIRILNVVMVGTFAFLTYQTVQIGLGNQTQLPTYFTLFSLVLLVGIPLIFVIPDWIKARKEN